MQVDIDLAIVYLKTAASLNNLAAQMRLAELYQQDFGSPLDYPALYSQLHHSLTDDKEIHSKISRLLRQLADRMPAKVVDKAKRTSYTN